MSLYESVFIARPDLSTSQVEKLAEKFAGFITENGGSIEKTEHWGLRQLAYPIKKNKKGHYVMFNVSAPSAALAEMERNMRISEDVMRFMSVSVEELDPTPAKAIEFKVTREPSHHKPKEFSARRPRHDDQSAPSEKTDAAATEPRGDA